MRVIVIQLFLLVCTFSTVFACYGAEDYEEEIIYDLQGPDSTGFPFSETVQIINDQMGPFSINGIETLSGGGLNALIADDLNCYFGPERCCWYNIAHGVDDLEWAVVNEQINYANVQVVFNPQRFPDPPFAVTAARQTHPLTQAFLASCPITCMSGPGILSFDHWLSKDVKLDVCTIKIDATNFSTCHTIRAREPITQQIDIPYVEHPFIIVIAASDFTRWPGGLAAIDNIKYSGSLCLDEKLPTGGKIEEAPPEVTTTGKPTTKVLSNAIFPFGAACRALWCDWSGDWPEFFPKAECHYSPLDTLDGIEAESAVPFNAIHSNKPYLGNWATGVIGKPSSGAAFGGGVVRSGEILAMKSASFILDWDINLEFEFWEATQDVDLHVCYDTHIVDDTCKTVSPVGVLPSHREWRKARLFVPKGKNRQVYFIARNTGDQIGVVGIGEIHLVADDTRKVVCPHERLDEFDSIEELKAALAKEGIYDKDDLKAAVDEKVEGGIRDQSK